MIEYKVEVNDDVTKWYLNGELHREDDQPALEYTQGLNIWYVNGKRHRENGAAVEFPDGKKYWWLEGKNYFEEEFNEKIKYKQDSCNGKMVEVDGKKYKLVELE